MCVCVCVCVYVRVCVHACVCAQLCLTLWPHGLQPTRGLCQWKFSSKDTGVGCHFLLQGIFPKHGLNLCCFESPALAGRFFTTSATYGFLKKLKIELLWSDNPLYPKDLKSGSQRDTIVLLLFFHPASGVILFKSIFLYAVSFSLINVQMTITFIFSTQNL